MVGWECAYAEPKEFQLQVSNCNFFKCPLHISIHCRLWHAGAIKIVLVPSCQSFLSPSPASIGGERVSGKRECTTGALPNSVLKRLIWIGWPFLPRTEFPTLHVVFDGKQIYIRESPDVEDVVFLSLSTIPISASHLFLIDPPGYVLYCQMKGYEINIMLDTPAPKLTASACSWDEWMDCVLLVNVTHGSHVVQSNLSCFPFDVRWKRLESQMNHSEP